MKTKFNRMEMIRSKEVTYKMVNTFDKEVITQSNTAFNLGTRFIVFNGRNTRSTRRDLIVFKFLPAPFSLKTEKCLFEWNQMDTYVKPKATNAQITTSASSKFHTSRQYAPS